MQDDRSVAALSRWNKHIDRAHFHAIIAAVARPAIVSSVRISDYHVLPPPLIEALIPTAARRAALSTESKWQTRTALRFLTANPLRMMRASKLLSAYYVSALQFTMVPNDTTRFKR